MLVTKSGITRYRLDKFGIRMSINSVKAAIDKGLIPVAEVKKVDRYGKKKARFYDLSDVVDRMEQER